MESCRIHERIIAVRDAISGKSNSRASAELAERIAEPPCRGDYRSCSGTSVAALGAARFRLRG